MENNHSTDDSGSDLTPVASNISVSELAARRLGGDLAPEEETPIAEPESEEVDLLSAKTEEVEETEEFVEESSADDEVEAVSSEDVLSQIDLDEMSEDDLRDLGKKLGSKAVERFGQLTAKRKAAEEELAKLRSSLEASDNDPLKGTQKVKNNPFGNIDSVEGIQNQADQVNSVIEWAEDVLFNADGYSPDDVVTEIEGKELTKSDVRNSLLSARKNRDKFLPAQLKSIQARQQGEKLKEAFNSKATEELSWMTGEDNDTRKQYEAIIGDSRFGQLEETLPPDLSAQLPYLMAHAANSIYGRREIKSGGKSARLKPPSQPTGAGAQSERKPSLQSKQIKDIKQRFSASGNKSDFVTLRTLQMQNR